MRSSVEGKREGGHQAGSLRKRSGVVARKMGKWAAQSAHYNLCWNQAPGFSLVGIFLTSRILIFYKDSVNPNFPRR